jgi:hypothetical protein
MKRVIASAVMVIASLVINVNVTNAGPMKDNEKYLTEAQARVKEFEVELEPERLREAYLDLENVILIQADEQTRAQLRANALSLWLRVLQLLDRFLDPKFNPDDVPLSGVQPPPTSKGVAYPPGADPALIDNPKARAEYEQAIAANRAKADHYRLQINLHRLNERIPPRAEAFIRNSYTSAQGDQEELRTAIEKIMKDPQRKAGLLKLLTPPDR